MRQKKKECVCARECKREREKKILVLTFDNEAHTGENNFKTLDTEFTINVNIISIIIIIIVINIIIFARYWTQTIG